MSSPIIVALDFENEKSASDFIAQIEPDDCQLKIGSDLFIQAGLPFIKKVQQKGFNIFLDLKLCDLPSTVENSVKTLADLGIWMITLHAAGGRRMMQQAKDALYEYGSQAPQLIAVTLLPGLDEQDVLEIGVKGTPMEQAMQLALLSKQCGLDGVLCSAKEVQSWRMRLGSDLSLVTLGVRPVGTSADDQRQIITPKRAMAAGSDYLVIGRPITRAADPKAVLLGLRSELS